MGRDLRVRNVLPMVGKLSLIFDSINRLFCIPMIFRVLVACLVVSWRDFIAKIHPPLSQVQLFKPKHKAYMVLK